jgi:glycosyltransferase involved in cell wall biosynthesis
MIQRKNKFSIIIPTFNSSKYIKNTLESVINQTYKNYEIIIVDDGSIDNTKNVIYEFFKSANNIKYRLIEQKNSGAGSARNNGINNAKFDWIAFLDSDDLWEFDKLKRINDYINQNKNYNFFCHNESFIMLNGTKSINDYSKKFNYKKSLTTQLFKNNFFSTSAVVVSKKILINYYGFDNSFKSAQDYELWLRMSPSLNVVFVKEVLGTYVMRDGNISTTNYWTRLWNILRIKFLHRDKVSFSVFLKNIVVSILIHIVTPIFKK